MEDPVTPVQPVAELSPEQQERRRRLIDAAFELGAEGGYEAVQMRSVSETANVAMATIYRYFSSKDHLLVGRDDGVDRRGSAAAWRSRRPRATPPPTRWSTCCSERAAPWSASRSWPTPSSGRCRRPTSACARAAPRCRAPHRRRWATTSSSGYPRGARRHPRGARPRLVLEPRRLGQRPSRLLFGGRRARAGHPVLIEPHERTARATAPAAAASPASFAERVSPRRAQPQAPSTTSATSAELVEVRAPTTSIVTPASSHAGEVVADLLATEPTREMSAAMRRGHRGDGLVALALEEQVLDLLGLGLVPHAGEDLLVEVHVPGAHAADVEARGPGRIASRAASTSSVTTTEQFGAISNEAGRPRARAVAKPSASQPSYMSRRPSGRSRSAASRRRSRRSSATFFGPSAPSQIGRSGRQRVGDRAERLAEPERARDRRRAAGGAGPAFVTGASRASTWRTMSTYSRVRASGFPNGAAVPALDHLRARDAEAEHEAAPARGGRG